VLLARLEILRTSPPPKPAVTADELEAMEEVARFRCPIWIPIEACNTRACPAKPDDPYGDYSDECIEARLARQRLRMVREGRISFQSGPGGWRMRLGV
jgi:hypothetical protein